MNIFLSIPFILCAAAYLGISVLVFRFAYCINEDLKQRKHYDEHPERYGVIPVFGIAIISILWPLESGGLLIFLCVGYKR